MFDFAETVEAMADSLIETARDRGVDLSDLTYQNFNTLLDDRFDDGGEARCEQFTDLGWDYAFQFGQMDSDGFDNAHHKCIEAAIQHIRVMHSV